MTDAGKQIENQGIAACMRLNEELRKQLDRYRWRPISEIHEDFGPCVLMNIDDPGKLGIGSNLQLDWEESKSEWTHFAEVPKLTNEDAYKLKLAMFPTCRNALFPGDPSTCQDDPCACDI